MHVQVGVVLFALFAKTATVETPVLNEKGEPTGNSEVTQAFWHSLVHGYDDRGKGWWKKFGTVFMHDTVLRRLTDDEASPLHPHALAILMHTQVQFI